MVSSALSGLSFIFLSIVCTLFRNTLVRFSVTIVTLFRISTHSSQFFWMDILLRFSVTILRLSNLFFASETLSFLRPVISTTWLFVTQSSFLPHPYVLRITHMTYCHSVPDIFTETRCSIISWAIFVYPFSSCGDAIINTPHWPRHRLLHAPATKGYPA